MVQVVPLQLLKKMAETVKSKKEEVKLNVGTPVRIVGATYGWGEVKEGDMGMIAEVKDRIHYVYIPRIDFAWRADLKDLEVVSSIIGSNIASSFVPNGTAGKVNQLLYQYMEFMRSGKGMLSRLQQKVEREIEEKTRQLEALTHLRYRYYERINRKDCMAPENTGGWFELYYFTGMLFQHYYESISIKEGYRVDAITKDIQVGYNGVEIPLGKYHISIAGDEIEIKSVGGKVIDGHHHPHVKIHPCWGTWLGKIREGLASFNYFRLLVDVAEFLHHYDESGWYLHVMYWSKDVEKRCHKCWELRERCKCVQIVCVHCGKPIRAEGADRCNCVRCPQSDEIVGKEYDEYCLKRCEYWDEKKGVCNG